MTTDKAALLFAKVSAINGRILGMQAENESRYVQQFAIAYSDTDFMEASKEIEAAIAEFQKPEPVVGKKKCCDCMSYFQPSNNDDCSYCDETHSNFQPRE